MTASLSTLAPRRNEILSTSYHSSLSPSLLLPVTHLRRCRRIHLPVSLSTMYLLSRLSPPLNLSAIPILSCISAASVVILLHLRCGPHRIVFPPGCPLLPRVRSQTCTSTPPGLSPPTADPIGHPSCTEPAPFASLSSPCRTSYPPPCRPCSYRRSEPTLWIRPVTS